MHYQSFIKYRQRPPTSAEEFNELRQLSQRLADIKFQEDVPDAVRKFLDALSVGAGLELLTGEVVAWLRDNKLLANYVVRARIKRRPMGDARAEFLSKVLDSIEERESRLLVWGIVDERFKRANWPIDLSVNRFGARRGIYGIF